MLRHKNIDRVCCIVLALTVLLGTVFIGAADAGVIAANNTLGYEDKLFDQGKVHTIDIRMDDWEGFLDTCTSENYSPCDVVIDGEKYTNVAIRGKGNTSLSSVAGYGNDRYSFKIEFDRYQSGMTYHGLDKLSLNNLIYDHTYMKDYWAYTLMNKMGVASSLCSFVHITVNGENWGLYLAVEGVEESFLQRNYGQDYGELYKPDSMNFGGGRGNGGGFDMEEFAEENGFTFGEENGEMSSPPTGGDFDGSFGGSSGAPAQPDFPQDDAAGSSGGQSSAPTATPAPTAAPTATPETTNSASGGDSAGGQTPQGGMLPDMNDFGGSEGGQIPAGGTAADSGDFAGSNGGQTPQGGMPEGNLPAGTPPTGGDFAPSSGEAAPAPSAEPTATTVPAPSAAPSINDFPAASFTPGNAPGGFQMPGGGGPGGMSGSDVKLQYIDDDPESYSNIFNSAKTPITQADQTRLIASLKALSEGDTSAVDTEAVIRYMAVHNFLVNDDSYTGMMVHNYYLYEEDGKLTMIPWDYNLAFGGMSATNATSAVNTPIDDLVSSMGGFGSSGGSDRPMAAWIMNSEEAMAQYRAFYQTFMDEVFSSGWFEAEFDRVTALIDPYVQNDREPFCTYEEYQTASATLRAFCLRRAQSICGQLDGSIPATSAGQRNSTALVDASDLDISALGSMGGGFGGGPGGGRSGQTERTQRPGASEKPAQTDAVPSSRVQAEGLRPSGDFSSFPGLSIQPQSTATQQENLGWLIGCTALLIAALVIARCKKTWQ